MIQLISQSLLASEIRRAHNLNAVSFQQDAILWHRGWQYVCYYAHKDKTSDSLYVSLGRRCCTDSFGKWEFLILEDYQQDVDDGHNTISMGICDGDGTIHVSFDQHCELLRFRMSIERVANEPSRFEWTASLFGPARSFLPGCDAGSALFQQLTYPRFLQTQESLMFSFRTGIAGAGSEQLFNYCGQSQRYTYIGECLTGAGNSPYINGISFARNRLHISGTYRGFVWYEGCGDPESGRHAVHAGPNGPENNYNLFYLYSDDKGKIFFNTEGKALANLDDGERILPDADGLTVFEIPQNNGIMNQEAQAADADGGFHALNREVNAWKHYYRAPNGSWSKHTIPNMEPTMNGPRGDIVAVRQGEQSAVLVALPSSLDGRLAVVKVMMNDQHVNETLWEGLGYSGEPHLISFTLGSNTVISVLTTTAKPKKQPVLLDFTIQLALQSDERGFEGN